MSHRFNEIVRFSYFLPFGFTSPSAAILGIKMPDNAHLAYSPTIPMDARLAEYERAYEAARRQLNFMTNGGYIRVINRKFGSSDSAQVRACCLSRSGLFLLTGTPDKAEERKRADFCRTKVSNRSVNYRSNSIDDVATRNYLFSIYSKDDPTDLELQVADDLLAKNIKAGSMSIMACAIALASSTSCSPTLMNNRQFYRCWRISNINALFMVNGFPTSLDRRPMTVSHTRIKDLDIPTDIPKLVQATLSSWYDSNPESYSFLSPDLSLHEVDPMQWNATPSFYHTAELPGLRISDAESAIALTGAANAVRHIFDGVAVGKSEAYIVHHTRPNYTPWIEETERKTTALVEACLRLNYPGYNERSKQNIDHAIIVCDTIHQFVALFRNAASKMPKRWRKERRVGAPYETVSIVPINASGAMQMRILLLGSPLEFEAMIIHSFTSQNSLVNPCHFKATTDPLFQLELTREKTDKSGTETIPVLLAHTMDFQRLFYAWEEYEKGTRFVVGCYPGQVKYIRKLMPDIEFI